MPAEMFCLTEGSPAPVIRWERDGEVVVESERVTIVTSPVSSTLTIDPTAAGDGGNYSCVASNPAGEDSAFFSLSVFGEQCTYLGTSCKCPYYSRTTQHVPQCGPGLGNLCSSSAILICTTHTHTHTHTHTYTYTHTCTNTHTHTHTHKHSHTHTHICTSAPPSVTASPEQGVVNIFDTGRSAAFVCRATGSPAPQVSQ